MDDFLFGENELALALVEVGGNLLSNGAAGETQTGRRSQQRNVNELADALPLVSLHLSHFEEVDVEGFV
nr:hypothetical protein [uncultured Prevotella sp.]